MIDIQMDGIYLDNGCLVKEAGIQPDDARENTIAYQILRAHSISEEPDRMQIKFDALISQDLTYVGIIQTARSSGMTEFPVPYAMTNCHNSLCAVGGTINEDDHVFGLTAAKKYGGNYVPANLAVMHAYVREELSACGGMILGSDSHSRYGALGTMGFGEGGPELVKQLLGRTYDIPSPEVVLCYVTGNTKRGVGPEDVALAMVAALFKPGTVKNKILEFTGPGLKNLSADYRCNIDTMMTETSCLSSIWETDEITEAYYRNHGRPGDYRKLKARSPAYYDGVIYLDLGRIESMIALPFHPSNAVTIHEFNERAKELLEEVDQEAERLFGKNKLQLSHKIKDGRVIADQGSIAGCAGGLFENLQEAAEILKDATLGKDGFSMTVYPASMPVNLALIRSGAAEKLLSSGVIMKPCICGSCSGYGDIPATHTFSIRHATRNFPNREGSRPDEGQYCAVALMDARSIAATAANQGVITAATDLDYQIPDLKYCFDGTVYKKRVYYGYGKADASVRLVTGPNIVDWPPMDELHDNILMRFSAVIHDPVTTTDELIPSGDTASYRSNPIRLAEYALCRRVPGYAGYCRSIQAVEEERKQGKMPEELVQVMKRFGIDEDMIAGTGYGSCLFANKPGDGSAREQAASCQKVLGGIANLCFEYATKRYRSNCINWGIIPFTLDGREKFDCVQGDYIFIEGIRKALLEGKKCIAARTLGSDGNVRGITLALEGLTETERDILLAGCLINYYRKQKIGEC